MVVVPSLVIGKLTGVVVVERSVPPPLSEKVVVARPLSESVAERTTFTSLVYQPLVPRVPVVVAVVVGAVVSGRTIPNCFAAYVASVLPSPS